MVLSPALEGNRLVQPAAIQGYGVPPASFRGELGQWFFDFTTTPPNGYVYNGQTWVDAGTDIGTFTTLTVTGQSNLGNTAVTGNLTATGTITAGTGLTSTTGPITAANGNLVLGTSGNKILSTSVGTVAAAGANSFGSVTLVGGTATVATTSVTTNSLIVTWRQSIGATGAAILGFISTANIVNGVSFDIRSVSQTDATSLQASDISVIGYMIIN
ncbi:MAG: hypothetical protein ABI554_02320 [Flavobacterium sp.]